MKIYFGRMRFIMMLGAIMMISLSCDKDDDGPADQSSNCDNITCLNGGTCVDGTCDCPSGFTGADCGQAVSGGGGGGGGNACDGINCENGGSCIDGACVCPQGYEGNACQDQTEPSQIRITSIRVSDLPEADFQNWDEDNSGPDLYVQIAYGNGDVIHNSYVIPDADINNDYTFTFSPPVIVNEVEGTHIFRLLDEDPGEDDQLGGIQTGSLYSPFNDFPPYIDTGGGGLVSFRVYVEYVW